MLRLQARAQRAAAEGKEDGGGKAPTLTHATWRWAALVFTKRQACAFVLNELVYRLPLFEPFFSTGSPLFSAAARALACALPPAPSARQEEN